MRKVIVILLVLVPFFSGAQQFTLPLWEGTIPNFKDAGETEIVKGTISRSISKVQNPTIEVYLPSESNNLGKAVVICPGGGYGTLAYDKEGSDIAKWLNGHGIAGIVLKYRLPNAKSNILPHESPLMDAKQAMKLVRQNAIDWGIDSSEVGIMGFSAGGHLASTLGTHFDSESRPDFMILMYPVISFDNKITHVGSRNNLLGEKPNQELVDYYSNELQVKADTPPTFIVHSMDDKAVPVENSLRFYQALKDKNVPSEMHLYPYGEHGYSLALNKGQLEGWKDRLIEWMREL